MHNDLAAELAGHTPFISTGQLPSAEVVDELLHEAYALFRTVDAGTVASYIPVLATASPDLFGLAIAGVNGAMTTAGEADVTFSIQSISKPFVFALVCQAIGHDAVREKVGVNSTGLPFNSMAALELTDDGSTNPLVNAGAIATTSLVPGATAAEKWAFVRDGLSRFAGRALALDEEVYRSEAASNEGNRAVATELHSRGRLYFDPLEATDVYTRQCSLEVTVTDLAIMSATLADGGVNPVTGERVVDADTCRRTLAVLSTAGLYERTGEWLYEIGLPAKSGVSGGIITIAPGKGGLATFSPPLDDAGNSVRGQLATRFLSDLLGLNLFSSAQHEPTAHQHAPQHSPV